MEWLSFQIDRRIDGHDSVNYGNGYDAELE